MTNERTGDLAKCKLVPFSGVQFYGTAFNREAGGNFGRTFFVPRRQLQPGATEQRLSIEPGWNDDNPDAEVRPSSAGATEISISKLKSYEAFVGEWMPIPMLKVLPGDSARRRNLDVGPTNWARVLITPQDAGETASAAVSFAVTYAFDTEVAPDGAEEGVYLMPTERDAYEESAFRLGSKVSEIARFLRDERTAERDGHPTRYDLQQWMSLWVERIFEKFKLAQRPGRMPDEEERREWPIEARCRYIAFLQFLARFAPPPELSFADALSADPEFRLRHDDVADKSRSPVGVSLVLDIGNSRTCGILIESFPTALRKAELRDAMLLRLRDLTLPHLTYHEPFESHVELAQPWFGPHDLSQMSGRPNAFFWPSPVRVGPEAIRFRDQAEGTEALSGLTGPKRYLFDVAALNQQWSFQRQCYERFGGAPPLDDLLRIYVGPRGDVKRQVAEDHALYRRLTYKYEDIDITAYPQRLSFSRSSMFTFMLAEIVWQAVCMINNPQVRATRAEADTPRKLERIILTVPTAMPITEQQILRSRAQAALKLLWDLTGWSLNRPAGVEFPTVEISLDEASCAQLVYLYGEITQHFAGGADEYFDLIGRPRPRPSDGDAKAAAPERSVRIASIDVGAGTTDLMVTTYFVEEGKALVPFQVFREGFRVAGDDLLRDVIERCVLPAVGRSLAECGGRSPREFLNRCFGIDRVDISEAERHIRRQCVTRLFRPASIAMLHAAEAADWTAEEQRVRRSLREMILAAKGTVDDPAARRAVRHLDDGAAAEGASGFSILDTPIEFAPCEVRNAVEAVFGDIFGNLAEIVDHLDCDLVLLSGRPSRLPALVDLLVNKLPTAPDRIVALGSYQAGPWYPFASLADFSISDPKTVTVTGAMLAFFAQRDIENFTIFTQRLRHRSCARQIGELSGSGQLRSANVKFDFEKRAPGGEERARLSWLAPVRLGYRQIPFDRWTATPLYLLRLVGGNTRDIVRPVAVDLVRDSGAEIADFADKEFAKNEALKEYLRIDTATADDGATVTPSFVLEFNTMGTLSGYWTDTGLLTIRQ